MVALSDLYAKRPGDKNDQSDSEGLGIVTENKKESDKERG